MKKITYFLTTFFLINTYAQTVFAPAVNIDPNTGDDPWTIASGDLDGDGDMDFVIGTYFTSSNNDFVKWYQNDGTGDFTMLLVSNDLDDIEGITIGNIDNQFGDDIIVSSPSSGKITVYFSDGMGGFTAELTVDDNLSFPGKIAVGDINSDGDLDIICSVYGAGVLWYAGDGSGNFSTANSIASSLNGPYFLDVGDFDEDNDIDVVVGYFDNGDIELFYNQYEESGTNTVSWVKDTEQIDTGSTRLTLVNFADVNNDGQLDILKVDNSGGNVSWFDKLKNGSSTEDIISDETIIDRPGAAFVADLDNDSLNDVVVTDAGVADDAVIWFKGNANVGPDDQESLIVNNNFQLYALAIEDFDNDMDNDIVTVGFQSNTIDYIENQLETLSTVKFTKDDFKLYPNPVNSQLFFASSELMDAQVMVTDFSGKIVFEGQLRLEEGLDVSYLTNGIYTLTINQNSNYRFVKM